MATESFTLAVVGHNLKAQCDVANSLLGNTSEPEIGQFKKQLTIKHIRWRFVAGNVQIAVTHSLDTPRWKEERKRLKQQKNKILLYVRAIGGFRIDDEEAIHNMKSFFGKKTNIILVIYHDAENNKLAEDECRKVIPMFRGNYICLKSSIEKMEKIEIVKQVLCMASNMVILSSTIKPHFRGSDLYDMCSASTEVANKADMAQSFPAQKQRGGSLSNWLSTRSISAPQGIEKYRNFDKRMESFKDWPLDIGLAPVLLARAGLFFTGKDDKCMCYECNVSLAKWRVDHDPWIQHIRANTKCTFLTKTWGREYMKEATNELLIHETEKKMIKEKLTMDKAVDVSKRKTERSGTPENTPVEITKLHWHHYMEMLTRVPNIKVSSFHTRVNIIGFQGVGKTTLLRRLRGMDLDLDHPPDPTEGLGIERSVSRTYEKKGTRHWESKSEGYDLEMNHERMALALEEVGPLIQTHGFQRTFHLVHETTTEVATETKNTFDRFITSNQDAKDDKQDQVEKTDSDISRTDEMSNNLEFGSEEVHEDKVIINGEKKEYLYNVLRKMQYSPGERIYLTYWDFAGQIAYYTTHQAFMSPSAVYLLVIDLSLSLHDIVEDNLTFRSTKFEKSSPIDTIKFWGGSIKAYTVDSNGSNAPVIVVGTHKDKVTQETIDEVFDTVRETMKIDDLACIAIDNTISAKDDVFLRELRDKLIDDGLGIIERKIPASWLRVEHNLLIQKQNGKRSIAFNDLSKICKEVDVSMDEGDLKLFLEYEHSNGFLIYYPDVNDEISNLIVLDPKVIVTLINKLMRPSQSSKSRSSKNSGWCRNGYFDRRYVDDAMSMDLEGLCVNVDQLLKLLEHLKIIHMKESGLPINDKRNKFFMPSLLRHNPKKNSLTPHKKCKDKTPSIKLSFKNQALPPSFFNSLTSSLMSKWKPYKIGDEVQLFDMYSCFDFGGKTSFLELCWSESCILMQAFNFSGQETLKDLGIDAVISTVRTHAYTILQTYRHLKTNFTVLIGCPKHEGLMPSYIKLDDLLEKSEAVCHYEECHGVSASEALGSWYSGNMDSYQQTDASLQKAVDEKMLTRLAKALKHDGANSLASKLQLDDTWCIAFKAKEESKRHKEIARFLIMIEWKRQLDESKSTLGKLKDLLTRLQVYKWDTLKKHIDRSVQHKSYEVDTTLLQQKPSDRDCMLVSSVSTDPRYIFLFIELGLTHVDIQRAQENTRDRTEETVNKLLIQWRDQYHETATLQVLLDTLSMLKMDTHQIIRKLKPPQAAKIPICVKKLA